MLNRKALIILIILLTLSISPAVAYKENWQHGFEGAATEWELIMDDPTYTGYLYQDTGWAYHNLGEEMQALGVYSSTIAIDHHAAWWPAGGFPSTYWAWTSTETYSYVPVRFYDTSGVQMCEEVIQYSEATGNTPKPAIRYECNVVDGEIKCTGNGEHPTGTYTHGCAAVAQNPSYIAIGYTSSGTHDAFVEDIIYGSLESKYIVGAISDNFYIKKDLVNPANTGIFFTNETLYRSNFYNVTYSKPDNSTGLGLQVKSFTSGTIAETLYVTDQAGWVSFNVSNLTSSAAPYGMMELTFDGTGVKDFFWYMAGGASVSWDRDLYATDDTALITYTIGSTYYDPSTYTYTMDIISDAGVLIDSQAIGSTSGSLSFEITDSVYSQDTTYYAVVNAEDSTGTAHYLGYDAMTTYSDVRLEGYVHDSSTGAVIAGANVVVNQSTDVINDISGADGSYAISGLNADTLLWFNTSAAGYTEDTHTFTPYALKTYTINITLLNESYFPPSGTAIVGRTYLLPYYHAQGDVNVSATNGTIPLSNYTLSMISGSYLFQDQPENTLEMVCASYGDYTAVTVPYSINTSTIGTYVVQDILMETTYNLTIEVRDATSRSLLTDSVIELSGAASGMYYTTDGRFYLSSDYGVTSVEASEPDHFSASYNYLMDRDRSVTIYLTAQESSSQTNLNQLYPREVRFLIVDRYNNKQSGVNVTARMTSSTIENTNWLQTLFGISGSATSINSTTLYGTTDSYGSVVFPMIASGMYTLTITKASAGISETKTIQPDQTSYTIIVGTTASAVASNKYDYIRMNLSVIDGGSNVWLVGVYNDTSLTTTHLQYYINFSNRTPYKSFTFSGNTLNFNHIINNTRGASYVWGINATSSTWGVNHIEQGITLKGAIGMLVNPMDPSRTGWD